MNALRNMMDTGDEQFPILGYVAWWNVRGVKINRTVFRDILNGLGLDGNKYARPHNYRSTFIRCLKGMEEKRIIRPVKEDQDRMIYQFTAETLVEDGDTPHLEYTQELQVEIDKSIYFAELEFGQALKCDSSIRQQLIEAFNEERESYNSSDITRYVQKIFNEEADIVSLRPQGAVYFVPAEYESIVTKVGQAMEAIPGDAQFDFFPVPDVKSARTMVGRGVNSEIAAEFAKMDREIQEVKAGTKEVTDKWVEHRKEVVQELKARIQMYSDVLGEAGGEFNRLAKEFGSRLIEI